MDVVELGERIRDARRSQRLSLMDVCRHADCHLNWLMKVEKGQTNPSVGKLAPVLQYLNLDWNTACGWEDQYAKANGSAVPEVYGPERYWSG